MTEPAADPVRDATPAREPHRAVPLLRRRELAAGVVAGAAGALGALARPAESAPSRSERSILRFLLIVERAQSAFYHEALRTGRLRGELARFAEVAATDEDAHVRRLERLLGTPSAAHRIAPTAAVRDPRAFTRTAVAVEELALAAYIGQGGNVAGRIATELAAILGTEGRHAAWIRDIADEDPAPAAQDLGRSSAAVMRGLERLGLA